jgi:hypothetical protein
MALLLVGGAMNVLWIALLAVLVLFEKLTAFGRWIARLAGSILVGAGIWMLLWHCSNAAPQSYRGDVPAVLVDRDPIRLESPPKPMRSELSVTGFL